MKLTHRKALQVASALLAASLIPTSARAAVVVWTGGAATPAWTDAVNWGGTLPDDVARFGDAGLAVETQVQLTGDITLNQIHFNGNTFAFSVTGGTIGLNGSGTGKVGLLRNNAAAADTQTIASALTLRDDLEFNIAGGAGNLVLAGPIGEFGGARGFTKVGSRPIELLGNNTFTGVVSLLQNNTILGHNKALGLGTSPVRIGRTSGTNQAFLLTKTGVTFDRDLIVRSGSTGVVRLGGQDGQTSGDWSGTLYLERDVELTGGNTANGAIRIAGAIVDATEALNVDGRNSFVSSNVTKVGNGRVKLEGNSTYSGTTQITAGALFVNGSLSLADALVTVGDRLGGSGTIHRPVSVLDTGTLVPGDVGIGTLTIGSGKLLFLADGAAINVELGATPANTDRVAASLVEFGANLDIKLTRRTGFASADDTFSLLTWTGADPVTLPSLTWDATSDYTGVFSFVGAGDGLPGGSLQLSQVSLVQVPEPSTLAMLPLVGLLMRRRWR